MNHPMKALLCIPNGRSQFIGKRYHIEVEKHGIIQSMSDAGNPYDNAIMESFNKSLKTMLTKSLPHEKRLKKSYLNT